MAYNFPEGSSFQFAPLSGFASAKNVTVITNASPAVATSTTHGYVDGDELLFISGWEDATASIYRADQLTADTVSLLGLDTTSTQFYPTGSGIGTLQKVGTWTQIPQVLTIATNGGDVRFSQINPLARRTGIQVPIGFNPISINLTIGHDAANAVYQTMLGISRTLQKVAFKLVLGSGGTTYGFGWMATGEFPTMTSGQANTVPVVFALEGRAISYAT